MSRVWLRVAAMWLLFFAALAATVATHLAVYQQTDFFQRWFVALLIIDAVLITLLLAVIVVRVLWLVYAWRRGQPGARLSLRLTLLFWGVSLLPALLLYTVSFSAVFRGIESWFDIPLGQSFERGITFGQDVIGREFDQLEYVARDIGDRLPPQQSQLSFYMNDVVLLYGLDSMVLYNRYGSLLASVGDGGGGPLSTAFIRRVRSDGLHLALRGEGINRVMEVIVPLAPGTGGNAVALAVVRALPPDIAEGLTEIERGRREYEQLQVLRRGLRWSFILTMSLAFLLILAALGWLSLWLGRSMTRPLVQLSVAAEAVGRGDLDRQLRDEHSLEEVAQLNRSFNSMIGDLQRSRREVSERQKALREANAYLENLLSSLTTGVLTFDVNGAFSGYNHAAERFFGKPLAPLLGATTLPESPLSGALSTAMHALRDDGEPTAETRAPQPDGAVLLVRALSLPDNAGSGMLVMIDDISRQIRAEREATWEEASRRFVHEIKNPLTPIQLSAERLHSKLAGRLERGDEEMLNRLVQMIVKQVDAMRQMVDSFRDYADKRSIPEALPLQLNELLREVLYFYENRQVQIDTRLQVDLPPILGNALTLRQLLHNVLVNAFDALSGVVAPVVRIETASIGGRVELCIEDNGGGVSEDMLKNLCEPYVTNKADGSGLGLAVVRKTVDDHGGDLNIVNGREGLRVTVRFKK